MPEMKRAKSRTRARANSTSRDAGLAKRALKLIGRPDYVVTDIVHSRPDSARKYDVVFVQQRWMGRSVYDGRRSVIFTRGKTRVTGKHVAVRSVTPMLPAIDAEAAVLAASKRVRPKVVIGAVETVSRSAGFDRQTVLRVEALPTLVTARLVVFGKGRARLAWVVTAEAPNGHALEAVVDAESRKVLHERGLSYQAEACLDIAPEAGGPAAGPPLKLTVDPAWLGTAPPRIVCRDTTGAPAPPPPPQPNGDFCGTATAFEQLALDALVIANLGLDRLMQTGGQTQGRVTVKLSTGATKSLGDVAFATPSLQTPSLTFAARDPSFRHSGADPSVVLHELAHLVLSRGVGGSDVATPFEKGGESGAVMEGLADFLGLTLWNSIRRSAGAPSDIEIFGSWLFEDKARDYAPLIANPATAPKLPFNNAKSVHEKGMLLCLALWLTRARILSSPGMDADDADVVMWKTVCDSLPKMPHQGSKPHFCCVSQALRSQIDQEFLGALEQALDDRNIRITDCNH